VTVKQLEAKVAELEKEIETLKARVPVEQHYHYHTYPQQYIQPQPYRYPGYPYTPYTPYYVGTSGGNSANPGPSGKTYNVTYTGNAAGN
jgi:hypothetical protein